MTNDPHANDNRPMWERQWVDPSSPPPPAQDTQRQTPLTPQQVDAALDDFLGTSTFDDTRVVLEQQRSLLLTLEAQRVLARRLERAERREARKMLRLHLELLMLAREQGIAAAWEWLDATIRSEAEETLLAMQALVDALTPEERRQFEALMAQANAGHPSEAQQRQIAAQVQELLARAAGRIQDAGGQRAGGGQGNGAPFAPRATPNQPFAPSPGAPNRPFAAPPTPPKVTPRPADPPAPSADWKASLGSYLNAADWPARFAILDAHAADLLTSEAVAETQATAMVYHQRRQADRAALMDECATVLSDARQRGLPAARTAFRQRHPEVTLPEPAAPVAPPVAAAPDPAEDDPIAMPNLSPEERRGAQRLLATPGALDDATRTALLVWFGESDADVPQTQIAAALQRIQAQLGA